MRPWRRAAIAVVALVGTVLGAGAGAGVARAQVPTTTSTTRDSGEHPTFDRSPAEGPPATVIKVWGAGCIYYGTPWEYASVYLASVSNEPGHEYHQRSREFPVADDGSWAGDITVPASAPAGEYTVRASCTASDMTLPAGKLPFMVSEVASPTSAQPSTMTAAPESPSTMVRSRVAAGPGTAVVTSSTMPVSSTTSTPSTIVGPQAAADRAVGPTGADEPQREIRWPGLLAIVSLCAITGGAGVRRRRGHPKISG